MFHSTLWYWNLAPIFAMASVVNLFMQVIREHNCRIKRTDQRALRILLKLLNFFYFFLHFQQDSSNCICHTLRESYEQHTSVWQWLMLYHFWKLTYWLRMVQKCMNGLWKPCWCVTLKIAEVAKFCNEKHESPFFSRNLLVYAKEKLLPDHMSAKMLIKNLKDYWRKNKKWIRTTKYQLQDVVKFSNCCCTFRYLT